MGVGGESWSSISAEFLGWMLGASIRACGFVFGARSRTRRQLYFCSEKNRVRRVALRSFSAVSGKRIAGIALRQKFLPGLQRLKVLKFREK
jgi:hypothetical protein